MVVSEFNIFNNPEYYRKAILKEEGLLNYNIKMNNGKSLICVFFTAFCGVGCPFCFFQSPSSNGFNNDLNFKFNEIAIKKFIKFANEANVGYLQISGGGEPFLEKNAILECVEKIKADRIILVTSGSRAFNEENCKKYLHEIYSAISKRKHKSRITIRLSVSKHHTIRLQNKPLINLLNIFAAEYKNNELFTLQLKIFEGDTTLEDVLKDKFYGYSLKLESKNGTDDIDHKKIIPWKYKLKLSSGYEVIVGKSRIFYSSLKPDITNINNVKKNINVYDIDLQLSQNDNSSIIHNNNGTNGLDWIVEYNGNVCTRQNRIQDNLLNIYEDDYNTVLKYTYQDPLTYSYIDKGNSYRNRIVEEISPQSVILMKSVNIRDYAGPLLFFDEKVRLYYTIRVIQDYIREGKINLGNIKNLPVELQNSIYMGKEQLQKLYFESEYNILTQLLSNPISENELYDFLYLLKLGHYKVSLEKKVELINYYNFLFHKNLKNLDDIVCLDDFSTERRLTKRVMVRKYIEAECNEKILYLYRHGETNLNKERRIKGQLKDINTFFTAHGIQQLKNIYKDIQKKHINAIFSSDLERTRDTSDFINQNLNLPLYYSKDFRGLNMGIFQGKIIDEFLLNKNVKKSFINHNCKIQGGESINDLLERFFHGLNIIYKEYEYNNIAIITHGAAISNIKSYLTGEVYEDIDYCALKIYKNNFEILYFGNYK